MKIFPDAYAKDVFQINYDKLYDIGVRNVIFDVDNTLISYDEVEPNERLIKLFDKIKEIGFEIFFVSNNTDKRVSYFCETLDFHYIANSQKPLPFKVKKGLSAYNINKKNSVIIGDQLLTDVLFSKFFGIRSILVVPISVRDMWYTKPSRFLERHLLKFDKRVRDYDFR